MFNAYTNISLQQMTRKEHKIADKFVKLQVVLFNIYIWLGLCGWYEYVIIHTPQTPLYICIGRHFLKEYFSAFSSHRLQHLHKICIDAKHICNKVFVLT